MSRDFAAGVKRTHPGALRDILATNLRRIRTERGLSQEAFGDLCGLDRSYVGSVERGQRNISIDNLERMAKALNLEPWQLIRRNDTGR
ncbi:helix-turn-helix transcriptional regulator [Methylobacterium sp. Leaf123]|uniref:helix-turn-helix domain-containing protein n=1 Tax=Methylobacterium sp. Leaf123 TaxID=1736264 RepID=UPI000A461880|nr:helix-turn-helix transcriptional regulator [Methylobacterium sp. Leaf123]